MKEATSSLKVLANKLSYRYWVLVVEEEVLTADIRYTCTHTHTHRQTHVLCGFQELNKKNALNKNSAELFYRHTATKIDPNRKITANTSPLDNFIKVKTKKIVLIEELPTVTILKDCTSFKSVDRVGEPVYLKINLEFVLPSCVHQFFVLRLV